MNQISPHTIQKIGNPIDIISKVKNRKYNRQEKQRQKRKHTTHSTK